MGYNISKEEKNGHHSHPLTVGIGIRDIIGHPHAHSIIVNIPSHSPLNDVYILVIRNFISQCTYLTSHAAKAIFAYLQGVWITEHLAQIQKRKIR